MVYFTVLEVLRGVFNGAPFENAPLNRRHLRVVQKSQNALQRHRAAEEDALEQVLRLLRDPRQRRRGAATSREVLLGVHTHI